MKSGWQTIKLGEVCQIKPPKAEARCQISKTDFVSFVPMEDLGIDQKFLWPTRTEPLAEVDKSYTYFASGDVLLAKITPCFENGKLGIAANLTNGIGFGSSEYIVFRPDHSMDKEWLYYFLSRETFRKEGAAHMSGAVGHKRLAKEFIEGYLIPLPPLPEQHRIIAILDKAFMCIAKAKANTEKNLKNARELFESYLHSIFTQKKDGWVETRLGDIAKTQYGLSESMNEEGKGFKIFRMGEVQDGRLIDTGQMKFADINRFEFEKYKLQPGDVLFNRTNSFELVGKTGIFDMPGDYCFASYLIRVLLNKTVVLPEFLNYFMNSKHFQNAVKQKASKSINQANINATILSKESVRFPESLKEQKTIITRLDSLRTETKRLESLYQKKLLALDELKQSLLHQAFTGQLSGNVL